MSKIFANQTYVNGNGELITVITQADPRALTKQFEKDIYDSGLIAGIKLERERISKLLDSQRGNGSHDAENDFINGLIDDFTALIKGDSQTDNETVSLLTEGETE